MRLDIASIRSRYELNKPRPWEPELKSEMRALCDRVDALEAALRELVPVLDRVVSAACAKTPPDYAETLDALDDVRNAVEGHE